MRRILFRFRTATWMKYGEVIFVEDDADRDRQFAALGKAEITVREDREATAAELAKYQAYRHWLATWQQKAREGQAGRWMMKPEAP